ncbi:MAG: hypothetical protein JW993_09670, partial [Sedimentisphaerales bacterium]|nr:hypothetical protein [Sedimentisphaerales bacterium]
MRRNVLVTLLSLWFALILVPGCASTKPSFETTGDQLSVLLPSDDLTPQAGQPALLRLDGLFFETSAGRVAVPADLAVESGGTLEGQARMPDGRVVTISVKPQGDSYTLQLSAKPDTDIIKWGLAIDATENEYFTGLMERVVDGRQQASWAPGIEAAMDLRGQKVDMILKPTTSVYAPFYLSSRGYGVFVKTDWPGVFDFCVDDPQRVKIEFEGPSLELKVYASDQPAELVCDHALEAGPPFLPPKWLYAPWRWRDEHRIRSEYYDGTAWSGPFNAEVMEDVLMMQAYG